MVNVWNTGARALPVKRFEPRRLMRLLVAYLLLASGGCHAPGETRVSVHYLGHASFLLTFGDSLTVLTDFGESRAYGLNSPIHPLGGIQPDILTLSHDHPDHAGGLLPDRPQRLLPGNGSFEGHGLAIQPIPTYEANLEASDNVSFLFEYGGLKILHLGDCQGLMTALGPVSDSNDRAGLERREVEDRIRALYPDRYDLVFLPIGFVRNILPEAADFLALLDARVVVPMHYWNPGDRGEFLALLDGRTDGRGRRYQVREELGATLKLAPGPEDPSFVEAVGLTPAPLSGG